MPHAESSTRYNAPVTQTLSVALANRSRASRSFAPLLAGVGGLVLLGVLAAVLPSYWAFLATSAIVSATALLGLGVVTGTAGMIALCQMSFAAIGAWVLAALNLMNFPGGVLVWIILAAAASGLAGLLIGLPALRVRGVNLAVVTLGFAASFDLLLTRVQFPGTVGFVPVSRPKLLATESMFFVFVGAVFIVCAVLLAYLKRSRIGAGWRLVGYSERALASAGGSVRTTKLSAFAVSAALAGTAGGLLMLQVGFGSPATFTPLQSLAMFLLASVVGAQLVEMAFFGGILWVGIPEILKRIGVDQNWALIVFAAMGVQALASRMTLGERVRALIRRDGGAVKSLRLADAAAALPAADRGTAPATDAPIADAPTDAPTVLRARELQVSFGNVVALNSVDIELRAGEVVALIGPNGAGKSTLIDALTGFLPVTGTVELAGTDLSAAAPAARARAGLRRTYQVDRVPTTLTIGHYVRLVARRTLRVAEMDELLAEFGCPPSDTSLSEVDAGTRRIIELVAHLASQPAAILLDEPAAGLSHDEHTALAELVAAIPARYGTSVLIIEHDLDLVRRVADRVIVLDFGTVIAEGEPHTVLNDPRVKKAYMGEAETIA